MWTLVEYFEQNIMFSCHFHCFIFSIFPPGYFILCHLSGYWNKKLQYVSSIWLPGLLFLKF